MSAALQYFEENLPLRPYHTDDLAFGLRISGKGRALLARYIQQNQPHAQFWLVFDVDREGAAIDWSDRNAPAPNITVKNPVNGHAHLLYALNIAVRTAPDASVKALKYAAAVERSLCEKLCADVNYSGLICKNPFHLEWLVMEWREEAYTLDELADYLDLSKRNTFTALQGLLADEEARTLMSMFLLASAKKNLSMCSFRLFGVQKPKEEEEQSEC